jgi:polyisoprenoid-binding protein YceI
MRKIIVLLFVSALVLNINAQEKYLTKTGHIKFFSHTVIENITADVENVGSIINAENGEVFISLSMTDFDFEKKLMEEHFNENYLESEKFPKSSFKGTIVNNSEVDYGLKGSYAVSVEGEMTIHGVTNTVSTEGTIEVKKDGIVAKASFMINPEDYEIKIPKVVRNKIAHDLEISVEMSYKPM